MSDTIILVANNDEARKLSSKDLKCDILITGEGRSNVIRTLAGCLKEGIITDDKTIINVGYVGAKGIEPGTVVKIGAVEPYISSETIKENCIFLKNIKANLSCQGCFTADNFVKASDDRVADLPKECVIDMELYYIALMFPYVNSYKIVSDELNYDEYTEASFEESWNKVKEYIKENL